MWSEFLYNAGVKLVGPVMRFGALFNQKLALGVTGRKNLFQELSDTFAERAKERPVAWFHAASLGEFEQGRPAMEEFRKSYPDYFILLTFFSPSGYEVRKNYAGADYICYLPIDTQSNAQAFVRTVKPKIAFFIKYEFWFNYLVELKKAGSKIISFSTIFREDQIFFKPYGGFYRKLLTFFDHIFVQNEASFQLLKAIGIESVSLAGDTRFDRVKAIASMARKLPEIASFIGDTFCIVAGSVWKEDMDILVPALNTLSNPAKVIFAPHEIKQEWMESWRKLLKGKSLLYSEYIKNNTNPDFDYLIIDNVGMLSSLYKYGDVAFIGGSYGSGLHNILEAATYGIPVLFGNKKYLKFQEAVDLVQKDGAKAIEDTAEMIRILNMLQNNIETRKKMGEVCRAYVLSGTGATAALMKEVRSLLKI